MPNLSIRFIKVSLSGLLILSLGLGCANFTEVQGFASWNYTKVVGRYTKKAEAYRQLNTVMVAGATYMDWPVRLAYARKYGADHLLTDAQLEEEINKQKVNWESATEFFVATFSDSENWDKLDAPDTNWSVYLYNDLGQRLEPSLIERQTKIPVYISEFYPSYSNWKKFYKIVFPKCNPDQTPFISEQTKYIKLQFIGPLGRVELKWELSSPRDKQVSLNRGGAWKT